MSASVTGWPIDKPIPLALTPAELQQIMRLSRSSFYAAQKAGKLRQFLLPKPVGMARYSGLKVQRLYIDGQTPTPFGRGSRTARAALVERAS